MALNAKIRGRDVIHVAMSYPLRDIAPLRQALGEEPGILYVSNQYTFSKALETGKYKDFFLDDFGGDFGHLTLRAADIVAEKIAETLLPFFQEACAKVNKL